MKENMPETYGCLSCKTAASFKGLVDRMPKTCPILTHQELTIDISAYRVNPLQKIMQVAD